MALLFPKTALGNPDAARASYEVLAPSYDQWWRRHIDTSLAKVLSALPLKGDERILDDACGTGELEQRLLVRWPDLHITGMDLCPAMLAQAKDKQIAGDTAWIKGEASHVPVTDGQFDVVISANSFHYFRKPMDSLKEFA